MWATGAMPPGIGTGSVARVDTAATRLVVSNAAEGAALRRCLANSFRMSNLVCAWLDAADRTSIAQKQASRVVMRGAARHPRRCGDGSIACMRIATSLFVLVLPQTRPANESPVPRSGTLREGTLDSALHCPPGRNPRQPESSGGWASLHRHFHTMGDGWPTSGFEIRSTHHLRTSFRANARAIV